MSQQYDDVHSKLKVTRVHMSQQYDAACDGPIGRELCRKTTSIWPNLGQNAKIAAMHALITPINWYGAFIRAI